MSILEVRCETTLPGWLRRDVESRLAFVADEVESAEIVDDGAMLRLRLRPSTGVDRREAIAAHARRLVATMATAMEPRCRVLEEQRTSPPGCGCDLDAALSDSCDLHEELRGVLVLGPRLATLVNTLESRLLDVVHAVQPVAFRFPALIDPVLLERLSAFQYFPHTLGFVGHLRRDLDVLERFAADARATREGVSAPDASFANPSALLTPAVCYHLYGYLAGRVLDESGLVATAQGKCFRHESTNMTSLERLWEFTMREVVFVGSEQFVLAGRDTMRRVARDFFAGLALDHHVETAHDHFFGAQYWRQSALQTAFELKLEVRATLPHKDKSLAVASYNYHQDFFGRRMDIRLADGSPAHTACVAFGLERLAYALMSQRGLDPAGWPASVRPESR